MIRRMSGYLLHERGLPRGYRVGFRDWDCDRVTIAPIGIHLLLRAYGFWRAHRWAGERLGVRLGFFALKEEGGYFSEGRWTWRFWSVLAERNRQFSERIGNKAREDRIARVEYERGRQEGVADFIHQALLDLDRRRNQLQETA